jgi:hypothetical protein
MINEDGAEQVSTHNLSATRSVAHTTLNPFDARPIRRSARAFACMRLRCCLHAHPSVLLHAIQCTVAVGSCRDLRRTLGRKRSLRSLESCSQYVSSVHVNNALCSCE